MGKKMDSAAFLIGSFLLMFVLLLFSGKDVRVVSVLSGVSAVCLFVIFKDIHKRVRTRFFKRKRKNTSKQVKALIYKENMDALNEVMSLLKKRYNLHSITNEGGRVYFKEGANEDFLEACIIRKYKASPDDILSLWREAKKVKPIRGILFLIPGKMDRDGKLLKYKIDQPRILILDSSALKTLYRKYGEIKNEKSYEKHASPIHFLKSAVNRKRALRYFAYALLLIVYYLIFGNVLYLAIGAFLTFVCLFSFFSNANSDQLFF